MIKRHFTNIIVCAALLVLFFIAPAQSGTAQYTYDNLNRLMQVQYGDGTIIQYTYDASGNRLTKQVTVPPPAPPGG